MALIDTDTKKAQHPLANLIPMAVWKENFKSKLDEKDYKFNSDDIWELKPGNLPEDDIQAFILLILRYGQDVDLTIEELMEFVSENFAMPVMDIYKSAAALGRTDILDYMEKHYPEILVEIKECDDLRDAWDYFLILSAGFLNDQVPVLDWFQKRVPEAMAFVISFKDYQCFSDATRFNALSALKWMSEHTPGALADMIEQDTYQPLFTALDNSFLEGVRWMLLEPNCLEYVRKYLKTNPNNYPALEELFLEADDLAKHASPLVVSCNLKVTNRYAQFYLSPANLPLKGNLEEEDAEDEQLFLLE